MVCHPSDACFDWGRLVQEGGELEWEGLSQVLECAGSRKQQGQISQ